MILRLFHRMFPTKHRFVEWQYWSGGRWCYSGFHKCKCGAWTPYEPPAPQRYRREV